MTRPARLPRSLRGRLLWTLVAVTAVVLLALDAVVHQALDGYLTDRTDTTLRAVSRRIVGHVRNAQPPGQGLAGSARMLGTSEYYLEIVRPGGERQALVPGLRDPEDPPPALPEPLRPSGRGPVTVPAEKAGGPEYRLLAQSLPDHRGTVVVAVPLTAQQGTLDRLLVAEAVGTLVALGLLTCAGLWILRRGLRPLESMARDADAIAAGRSDHRVGPANEDSEVGRLGIALNIMLDRREDAQERLRRFVADASHELRTPVTAILGYADLRHQGVLDDPVHRERVLAGMSGEALRMRRLVDDLLTLSRLDGTHSPREYAPADLAEIAAAAVAAARVVDSSRPVLLTPPEGALLVLGDGDHLRRVVDNLLANVRAHTPRGTTAQVTVVHGPDAPDRVELSVTDDGPGIPAATLPRVLDRFSRGPGPHRGEGTGLGLAIVAAVAGAHGGRVTVEAAGERGTRVTVTLPALRAG